MENFVSRNESPAASPETPEQLQQITDNVPSDRPAMLQGLMMSVTQRAPGAPRPAPTAFSAGEPWDSLYVTLPVLGLLLVWRWRRRIYL
jgi:uncharacterized protein (TIGR03382 family)